MLWKFYTVKIPVENKDYDYICTSRYIVGSKTASALGDWRWALRVTPVLGLVAVVLIFFTRDPERGQHEGSHGRTTSYKADLLGKWHLLSISYYYLQYSYQYFQFQIYFTRMWRYMAKSIIHVINAGFYMRSICNRCLSLVGTKIHVVWPEVTGRRWKC